MNKNVKMITTGEEGRVLVKLALPMTAGILGMIIFNLMDTYFVGKLGTVELAALSFTFPVIMIISSIAHGLGVGMTTAVSRATGRQDRESQIRLVTHGMILSFLVVLVFVIIGQMTIDPVFRLLGADDTTLPVIKEYMRIWYWGVVFVVVPMTGNSAIRGLGDTKTPGIVMMIAALINTVLDPLLIFGIGPFPELGVAGAALATVTARAITFCVAIYILGFRDKVFSFRGERLTGFWKSWKEILYVGVPNSLTKMIVPIGAGVVTGIIARNGRAAVAGFGVATRIELFSLLFSNSLISVLPVFIGQNWGRGRKDRVLRGLRLSENFTLIYGALLYVILFFTARPLGGLFNPNPDVVDVIVYYLRIVPLGYGLQAMMQVGVTSLNVLKKPIPAALLTLIQMFCLYIPLATVGNLHFGIFGIFASLALSYLIMGPVTHIMNKNYITKLKCG
ncbi:MAG: MATE family efflux transporter [Spirochaetales bacterium]|nr:MATE family efflux transporter [Spirochaetales bacterium]